MTIVHPPSLDRDTDAIESLDFSPACQYEPHEECGHEGPAVWYALISGCSCGDAVHWVLFCDQCWSYRNSAGWVYCDQCGAAEPAWDTVLRLERI